MTPDESPPASAADLQRQLGSLFREANRNGIDVVGGWDFRNEDGMDWDVVVTELDTRSHAE